MAHSVLVPTDVKTADGHTGHVVKAKDCAAVDPQEDTTSSP